MSSIQNNNLQLFAETALNHAKIGNTFHINTLLEENYYRIPEDLKNKLLQIITSFAKDSIRTIDRGLLESRVQDAISAQVEMQAHDTNKNPRLEASKTTPFNLLNDLKWTIYSYLDPRELTTLGYVSRSVQKIIFQDILAVLNRDLRSSITNLPLYVKALHLPEIPDVFDISPIKYDKLNMLSLSNSNTTDIQLTQIIDRCPNLTTIYLTNCPRITDTAVKELAAKCPLLTTIGLNGCRLITDAAVKELAAKYPLLKAIGLDSCTLITDASVKELAAKCPLLTTIGLNDCRLITDAAVKELATKCPLLKEIYLSETPITPISCIFLAKYSSKLKQIGASPKLQDMFQQYKQAFSYKPHTELGKVYNSAINDIINQKYGESNNPEFLNYVFNLQFNNKINILKQIESEMFKKIDSLNEEDKNKFYLFVHQLAESPCVSELLKWGKENYKANYARAADALHMLESSKMAGHDKLESKQE